MPSPDLPTRADPTHARGAGRRRGSSYLSGLSMGLCLLLIGSLLGGPLVGLLLLAAAVLAAEVVTARRET